MITPLERPSAAAVYEALITDDQNPVILRFPYREEAEHFQRLFHAGLLKENEAVMSAVNYSPTEEYHHQITLTFWR